MRRLVAVAFAGALVAFAAVGCGGDDDAGSRAAPDAATVQLVVQLVRHDERGVVIANQAVAQSDDAALRDAAQELADGQRERAELLEAVLDRWEVPAEDRRELDRVDRPDAAESAAMASCTLVRDPDAVSRLANTPSGSFDAEYERLARAQVRSGRALANEIVASAALGDEDGDRLDGLTGSLHASTV